MAEESDVVKDNVDEELHQRKCSLLGEFRTVSAYLVAAPAENWLDRGGDTKELNNTISAAFYLDARFGSAVKSFANLELTGYPEGLATAQIGEGEKMDRMIKCNYKNNLYYNGSNSH
jgi:hypothetical protein